MKLNAAVQKLRSDLKTDISEAINNFAEEDQLNENLLFLREEYKAAVDDLGDQITIIGTNTGIWN